MYYPLHVIVLNDELHTLSVYSTESQESYYRKELATLCSTTICIGLAVDPHGPLTNLIDGAHYFNPLMCLSHDQIPVPRLDEAHVLFLPCF